MGFMDAFLGRPQMRLLPGISDSISGLNSINFGLGKAGKTAKHFLRDWSSGADTSDSGFYQPLRQQEAADLSDIDMDYATGANVLNATGSGEQANQINAMRDRAKENRREQTGRQTVDAMTGLAGWASDTLERATARRDSDELARQGLLLDARRSQYNATPTGGFLGQMLSGASQAGSAYLGKTCWIAAAIYGEGDPRVDKVRSYLSDWENTSPVGAFVVWLYRRYGERVAKRKWMVRCLTPLFNYWLRKTTVSRLNGTYSVTIVDYRQTTGAISARRNAR